MGSKIGHPVAGFFGGRAGVLGAASNNVDGINVKDSYTMGNSIARVGLGTAVGAGSGYGAKVLGEKMLSSNLEGYPDLSDEVKEQAIKQFHNNTENLVPEEAFIGGTAALLAPAVGYGTGKLFGSRNKDKTYYETRLNK